MQVAVLCVLALAPVFSLANSVVGRPICCWWMRACPMTQATPMQDMANCHMQASCHTVAPAPLLTAAPSVPLYPPAALQQLAVGRAARHHAFAPGAAPQFGFLPSIFHVPLA